MSQPSLRFRGPSYEDTESPSTGGCDTGKPQGRLPDSRLALQRERDRTFLLTVEEHVYGGELDLPAHDVDGHRCATMNGRLDYCNQESRHAAVRGRHGGPGM